MNEMRDSGPLLVTVECPWCAGPIGWDATTDVVDCLRCSTRVEIAFDAGVTPRARADQPADRPTTTACPACAAA